MSNHSFSDTKALREEFRERKKTNPISPSLINLFVPLFFLFPLSWNTLLFGFCLLQVQSSIIAEATCRHHEAQTRGQHGEECTRSSFLRFGTHA